MSLLLVLLAYVSICAVNADSICFIGDVQAAYDLVDPRPFMGTYSAIDSADLDTAIQRISSLTPDDTYEIDTAANIYLHTWQVTDFVKDIDQYLGDVVNYQYLFKAKNIGPNTDRSGWLLTMQSRNFPRNSYSNHTLACYRDPILNCQFREWYYGYNNTQNAIPSIKIINGSCPSYVVVIL